MLRKGQMISFKRPDSHMAQVLQAVENNSRNTYEIVKYTKLRKGQVLGALGNLSTIGAIVSIKTISNKSEWSIPGEFRAPVAQCFRRVRSIFDVR